jgi:hypothetical protein
MGNACIVSIGGVFMQVFAQQSGVLLADKVWTQLKFYCLLLTHM